MKIFGVGRNYIEHAKELDNPVPEEPVIFLKPETAYLPNGGIFYLPDFSSNVHYEGELVLRICRDGKAIEEREAARYFDSVSVGIDFTARDIQKRCKEKGLPWELAKAFDGSAAVGDFIAITSVPNFSNIEFTLNKNGEAAQKGCSRDLIFPFAFLISYISRFFTLKSGDLIFTGTPEGVGMVKAGDRFEGYIHEQKLLDIEIK